MAAFWYVVIPWSAMIMVYIGRPAIFVAAVLYAYAKRSKASFVVLAGLLLKSVGDLADFWICHKIVNSGQLIEAVHSSSIHLSSIVLSNLGPVLIGVGVLIVAVQEFIGRRKSLRLNNERP